MIPGTLRRATAAAETRRVALIGAAPGSVEASWLAACAGPGLTVIGTGRDGPRTLSLVQDGVDAIVLPAAEPAYRELILTALDRGVAVCCGPAGSTNVPAAAELAAAARRSGVPAVVAFPWRVHTALRDARQAIAAGILGELLTFDCTSHEDPSGVVHQLDLLRWSTGQEWTVDTVWANPGAAVTSLGLRTGPSGPYARILTSRLGRGEPRFQLTAIGTRATLLVVVNPRDGAGLWRLTCGSSTGERVFGATSRNPYPEFLTSGTGPTFDDALAAHRLARAAERP
ncbi:hypothetical protein [Actinoplanes sp. NPDC051859]|uniref:hypothetical protein n=1 Tax=Actinoplanes sp. NPDC051859 TaxID=3363909 RepID=UPI0037BCD61E